MHEPGGFISFGINQKWWAGLTKTEQLTIETACQMECEIAMSENNANNATYLKKLINEHGVKLREFNDDVYDSFGEAAEQVMEETRAHSALAKKVHDSFADARKNVGSWMKLSDVSYSLKRNRVLGL